MKRLRARGDRGSASIAVVLFALVAMALAAFVIDGGLAISEREQAADIAEQGARWVANDIDVDKLRTDPLAVPVISGDAVDRCGDLVGGIITDSGATGTSTCVFDADMREVTVTVHLQYHPMLTGLFFTGTLDVFGHATAGPQNQATP
ncbi:MAG: Membrane protein [Actinomycetia bacterium]|nr:Membrane protein [Actinomycetes bacterium]MDQ1659332.1 hypothetical protein [Cryptosporangiaceae bacterium]